MELSLTQANGYKYEVIGGQHNLMACKKVLLKKPEMKVLKTRQCQVYRGEDLSFQAKAYLGAMNNQIGSTRRADLMHEQVNK